MNGQKLKEQKHAFNLDDVNTHIHVSTWMFWTGTNVTLLKGLLLESLLYLMTLETLALQSTDHFLSSLSFNLSSMLKWICLLIHLYALKVPMLLIVKIYICGRENELILYTMFLYRPGNLSSRPPDCYWEISMTMLDSLIINWLIINSSIQS